MLRIGVTDQGPGIAPENLGVIFERFKQVGDPSDRAPRASGGLNIANELAALNLGAMHVESELGRQHVQLQAPAPRSRGDLARFMEHVPAAARGTRRPAGGRAVGAAESSGKLRTLSPPHTQPMDLIYEAAGGGALLLMDSPSAGAWARRLRDVHAETVRQSPGGELGDIEVRVAASALPGRAGSGPRHHRGRDARSTKQ